MTHNLADREIYLSILVIFKIYNFKILEKYVDQLKVRSYIYDSLETGLKFKDVNFEKLI